ncbi:MAG TPA: cupredoxin domain-containing protein [Candidatus Limnocylindrales bacterium]|nr:cupredoxin domain-containing protein [Candidatus Limnocylindrales bacterium]
MARRSIALLVILLALAVQPALAHDSASGTPDATITVTDRLSRRDIGVHAGAIVRFTNRDDERHRFRSRDGAGFDTGNIEPGESAQVRLAGAGTYTFIDERTEDRRYAGRIVVGASSSGSGDEPGTPRATATVTIGDRIFQPATTRLAAGGSVTFRNADSDDHTATGGIIDTGTLSPGASYRQTFPTPGTYDFLCIFHPEMRGTIEVVGAPQPAPSTEAAPPTEPRAMPPAGAPSASSAETASIGIVDLAFEPAALEVPTGTTVRWTNTGAAPHTATAEDGTFDSEILQAGEAFEHTFTAPGTYAYVCKVHPDMTGSISVTKPPEVAAAPVVPTSPAVAAAPEGAATATEPTVQPADIGSLGGIGLTVLLVSIASGLFARVVRGTVRA